MSFFIHNFNFSIKKLEELLVFNNDNRYLVLNNLIIISNIILPQSKLLDLHLTNYVIKSQGRLSNNWDILDDKGNKIGKTKGGGILGVLPGKNELLDSEDVLILTLKPLVGFFRKGDKIELRDSSHNLMGIVKFLNETNFFEVFFLEDSNGVEIFRGDYPTTNLPSEVYDNKGNVIAEVTKEKKIFLVNLIGV